MKNKQKTPKIGKKLVKSIVQTTDNYMTSHHINPLIIDVRHTNYLITDNLLLSPDRSCQTWENTGKVCRFCTDTYCKGNPTTCNP